LLALISCARKIAESNLQLSQPRRAGTGSASIYEGAHFMKVCGKDILVHGRLLRTARMDGDKYEFLQDPETVLEGIRSSGIRVDLFTFLQKPPETEPKFNYPMERDNLAVLRVSTFDHWWTKTVDAKTRNMVRKAEKKGVQVREMPFDDNLLRGISGVYNECPVRQGKPFAHYGKDMETLRQEFGTFPDSSIFIAAFLGDAMIGFIKLVCDETRTQAGLMQIVSMVQHRDKAPSNALVAQAVRACADRGISYLAYSNFAYGNKQRDSLSDFKKSNGFERIDLPRYYVPMTLLGSAALRLGLHRKLTNRVPELRSSWYKRKLQPAAETAWSEKTESPAVTPRSAGTV
jgi:hypothetical protein